MGFSTPPSSGGGASGLFGTILTGTVPTQGNTGFNTWLNQGTGTVADTSIGVTMSPQNISAMTGFGRAKPATPYTAKALVSLSFPFGTGAQYGLGIWDAVSTKLMFIHVYGNQYLLQAWNAYNSYNNTLQSGGNPNLPPWFSVADDGTNFTFGYSMDGLNFGTFFSQPISSSILSGGYTHVGLMIQPQSGAGEKFSLLSWSIS
jgi:hypothetical protein